MERPIDDQLRALRAVHESLWDPAAELVRIAPGVNPGIDLSGWNLHAVRETALGAIVDLRHGEIARAAAGIRRVLANQYRAEGVPWSGTFKVCAEEDEPRNGHATEWLHYDPNWRQFLGCILAYTLERHEATLPRGLGVEMEAAIARCVRGEPHDRVAAWYTNPNLMHAWLESWVGVRQDDRRQVRAGEIRLERIMERCERLGDVDEYNSPTYDGIDLWAAALWASFPPTAGFAEAGGRLVARIGARLARLFHPGLAAICGPYCRAYGLSLDRYVSLAGQWLALAGADPTRVLPPTLDERTIHVHDLYFLEMFDDLGDVVVPHLRIEDVESPRRHEQRFGDVVAVSYLDAAWAVGAERGRIPKFATDQYVPFAAHDAHDGAVASVGVKLGESTSTIDASLHDERTATLLATGSADSVELLLAFSSAPAVQGRTVHLGDLTLECSATPSRVVTDPEAGVTHVRVRFDVPEVRMTARLAPGRPHRS